MKPIGLLFLWHIRVEDGCFVEHFSGYKLARLSPAVHVEEVAITGVLAWSALKRLNIRGEDNIVIARFSRRTSCLGIVT